MDKTLSEIRINAGFKTQESLAEKINCTRSAVAKWETGLCYPPVHKIILLSRILNVSEKDLINAIALVRRDRDNC